MCGGGVMDNLSIALISIVIAQNFYLIREVVRLKAEFKNHLRYLHGEVKR